MIATDGCSTFADNLSVFLGPPPDIAKSLTLAYAGSFKGKITARHAACESDQTVKVFRQRPGDDRLIGEERRTAATGHYSVPGAGNPGSYYATTPRRSIPGVADCQAGRSPTLTLP